MSERQNFIEKTLAYTKKQTLISIGVIKYFGIIGFLSFISFFVILKFLPQADAEYKKTLFRLFCAVLSFPLAFIDYWPGRLKKALPAYWYLTLFVTLPFFGTYMFFHNAASELWLTNIVIGLFWLILVTDIYSFVVLLFFGMWSGWFLYYLETGGTYLENKNIATALILYLFAILIGIVFAGKRYFLNKKTVDLLEEQVSEKTKDLQVALAIKTDFVNSMSHEIRTPIEGVYGISVGLVEHWKTLDEKERYEYVRQIAESSSRLSSLVGHILDISKISSKGKMLLTINKLNLTKLVKDIAKENKTLYFPKKKLVYKFNFKKKFEIKGDIERISQLLRNLFVNAAKYSSKGGQIDVDIKNTEFLNNKDKLVKAIHITIADKGIGIPEDELELIFEPFAMSSRTKTRAGGTGLGLSICKQIVLAHKGKIYAENNTSKGAKFNVILPVNQYKKIKKTPKIEKIKNKKEQLTILVIDDEEACLSSMELILKQDDYKVIKALGGNEGLEALAKYNNKIDIILLDLMMPDIYGITFLETIKADKSLRFPRVIIQSGVADEAELDKCNKLGAVGYLRKPYNRAQVLKTIKNIMH